MSDALPSRVPAGAASSSSSFRQGTLPRRSPHLLACRSNPAATVASRLRGWEAEPEAAGPRPGGQWTRCGDGLARPAATGGGAFFDSGGKPPARRGARSSEHGSACAGRYLGRMADHSTLGEFLRAQGVPDDRLDAAVSAYLADPQRGAFEIGDGLTLNIAAAVRAHPWAHMVADDADVSVAARRLAVRTAVLLSAVPRPMG